MKKCTDTAELTVALAAAMDLPLPLEFFEEWAKRSKFFEWQKAEGLELHVVNGHACCYADLFGTFAARKFRLSRRPSVFATTGTSACLQLAQATGLPLRIEAYRAWAGKSQIHDWKKEGLRVENVNGHACLYPHDFAEFVRTKFSLRRAETLAA